MGEVVSSSSGRRSGVSSSSSVGAGLVVGVKC